MDYDSVSHIAVIILNGQIIDRLNFPCRFGAPHPVPCVGCVCQVRPAGIPGKRHHIAGLLCDFPPFNHPVFTRHSPEHSSRIPLDFPKYPQPFRQLFADGRHPPFILLRPVSVTVKEPVQYCLPVFFRQRIHPRHYIFSAGIFPEIVREPVTKHLPAEPELDCGPAPFHAVRGCDLFHYGAELIFLIVGIAEVNLPAALPLRPAGSLPVTDPPVTKPSSHKIKKVPIHQGHRLLLPAPRIMRTYHLCFLNLSWNAPQPAFHIRRWYP